MTELHQANQHTQQRKRKECAAEPVARIQGAVTFYASSCPLRTEMAILDMVDTSTQRLCRQLNLGSYFVGTLHCDFDFMSLEAVLFLHPVQIETFILAHGTRTISVKHVVRMMDMDGAEHKQIAVIKEILVWIASRVPDELCNLATDGNTAFDFRFPSLPSLPITNKRENEFTIPYSELSTGGHLQFARFTYFYNQAAANLGFHSSGSYMVKYIKEVLPSMKHFSIETTHRPEGVLYMCMYADGVLVNECLMKLDQTISAKL